MPSFFRKKRGGASTPAVATTSTTPKKTTTSAADALKNAFAGDKSLLQLHEETATLLRLVKTPATTPVKRSSSKSSATGESASPMKARMTIEVLDDDDSDSDGNGADTTSHAATASKPSGSRVESTSEMRGTALIKSPLRPAASDPFAFQAEEARVRRAADTFYPHTSPSKRGLDAQISALSTEQLRLAQLARNDELEHARHRDEIAHHERHKLPSRLDTSAITIQAHARGFLCRKHQQTAAAARARALADEWHEVRDVARNEVWYYNARTGQSQWDVPHGLASTAAVGSMASSSVSLPELPTIKSSSSGRGDAMQRTASGSGAELLPPLSPSTSLCSSARSDTSDRMVTPSGVPLNRAPVPTVRTAASATRKNLSASLPVLQPQRTDSNNAAAVHSVPNPWDCDSVLDGSDASLCSNRTRDDLDGYDDDDDDGNRTDRSASPYAGGTRNNVDSFARRRSVLDRRRSIDTDDTDCTNVDDTVAGDWQVNDALFLADGSRNSKLRDTIHQALHVSKFDSIATLLASNVVLRQKPSHRRHPIVSTDTIAALSPTHGHERAGRGGSNTKRRTAGREVVLGKRDAPLFVAVLATDKSKSQMSPTARNNSSISSNGISSNGTKHSPLRSVTPMKTRARGVGTAALTSPPRIRDLADPGFEDDSDDDDQQQQQHQAHYADTDTDTKHTSPSKSSTVCFNCWSSSTGRFCDRHTDPLAGRKVHAAASALVCANWDLDQLRRKYRAEELQEVFLRQSASLRYDKQLKQYVTVVECRHPVYRSVAALLAAWNRTMRRKLHTRAWFRSFIEHLRSGRVPRATATDSPTPGLLKLRNTLQNSRWCSAYSATVRAFHPVAPVTQRDHSGRRPPIPDVIMVHPARPQLRYWVLVTEYAVPIELFRPRVYELPPRRCVPMPTPSVVDAVPLPVPNVYIDCGHVASWLERLCARVSSAALAKAVLQIRACSPPLGVTALRRTPHAPPPPLTVLFATFGRRATPGNVAVGGLSAELLIHMLVTTYVPAQFGNFVVTDRRAIAPTLTRDHDVVYVCLAVDAATPLYVFRALEHALNVRRAPCIVLATRAFSNESAPDWSDISISIGISTNASISTRFPANRPEQTGEEQYYGFRTVWLVDAFAVRDDVASVTVQPTRDVLSPNATSMHATATTHVDRTYPFCIPTTKENSPVAYIHLLWTGQSSRNDPQVFTTLGAQQPGAFMQHSDPHGALGVCTTVIYRSWAGAQRSNAEEFVTADGVAYWYDKQTGETYWTQPLQPAGNTDSVVVSDGKGEVATRGVGAVDSDSALKYDQQAVRKYMTKSMETVDETARRVQRVAASAKKHDIVVDVVGSSADTQQQQLSAAAASPQRRAVLEKVKVPQLAFKRGDSAARPSKRVVGSGTNSTSATNGSFAMLSSPAKQQQQLGGSSTAETLGTASLDASTQQLIASITQALGSAMPSGSSVGGTGSSSVDMLQLGIGLGMGLGLRVQQTQQTQQPDLSRGQQTARGSSVSSGFRGTDLTHHDDDDDNVDGDDDASTARSDASTDSDGSLSTTRSTASSVSITLPPDEQELHGVQRTSVPPGHLAKTPGYQTHAPPGEGSTWLAKPVDATSASQTAVAGFAGAVHQRVACLPKDFVTTVTITKTCRMQANYLPVIRNTNEPRSVGVVWPRGALQDWLPTSYSPWSAGRAVFGTQFIPDLMQRPELVTQMNGTGTSTGTNNAVAKTATGASVEKREKVSQAVKESQQLEELFSHCRHGKYDDVELSLNSPDWTLSIDAKDALGNTLLSIACQNNNKRIAKLCLRRGADINTQNLNGQTVLHYCHEYGFHDLLEYLMDKGARDDVVNADGLTCYEGLNKEAVDAI